MHRALRGGEAVSGSYPTQNRTRASQREAACLPPVLR
jgi:hypothetical protein